MNNNENYFEPMQTTTLRMHSIRTFGWLSIGLLITSIVAFALNSMNTVIYIYNNPFMPIILLVAQFGVVIALASRIMKMSATSAKILFILYSVLTGVTFSVLGLAYLSSTLATAFMVTMIYFGSLVVIGLTTKMDLLRLQPIILGALLAFIVTEVIMVLLGVGIDSMIFAGIGLAIFTALTAFDAQKMKALYNQYADDEEMLKRLSIYSALDLYLDFINIFLYILRFLGKKN